MKGMTLSTELQQVDCSITCDGGASSTVFPVTGTPRIIIYRIVEEAVMSKTSGGCLCGAIRYSISADPLMVAACHCKDCQKQTGSAYSIVLGVAADSLTIESGSPKSFEKTGTSGLPVERKFCGDCGSPILTDVKAVEGLLFLKGGTLDDTSSIEVGAEIWCDSKAEWATLSDSLPKHPGNPPAG